MNPSGKPVTGQQQSSEIVTDSHFDIDVRDVLQHQRDKSYGTLGEAFESLFHTYFAIRDDQVVNTTGEDLV